ncbi:Mediator of RNA polymerase II transcription subunit 15 [Dissostichus eleginoides]|uniref:Mediator of RNA polymerase II transcription subunit 15 n=1 Tax=Dissostichus eleginoides TaxID=100907 RepID=A0AAD9FAF9_DISEL|nr:Mediator of RNA polymerase II transcription subunit 15 [Dissostichus eleginoides]
MDLPEVELEHGESPEQHKKLVCFYGGAAPLPPLLHLLLRSGRRGDTPPVGRQDALLKAHRTGDSPAPRLQIRPAEDTGCQVGLKLITLLYPQIVPPLLHCIADLTVLKQRW